ncbi:MAG TPA: aminoacyl-tRNA hydrolase [Steroidobacteraceae bacterium]|nr:aminoacyl-tRNA hydrolase [Steroidobacteraceae bacterium]
MPGVPLKLIAGLGNPGAEYVRTRHNVGFWFADELARRHGGVFRFEPRHQAAIARARIGPTEIWLVKPRTYMNASGTAVGSVAHFYKIAPEETLVAYDELDFPPGKVRLRQGGGTAGHNGVSDIVAHVGESFWRLRIGIGRPSAKGAGMERVLSRPPAEEEQAILEAIAAGADAVAAMLEQGAQIAMNRLHSRDAPPRPDEPPDEPSAPPPERKM